MLPLRWSAAWMAGLAVATVWALGFDVPVTMLGVGWWLVGVTFRHHEQISARLRHRADELAAEQERFAAEAVRLERARIARELHDVVAHCMTVIVIQARAGQQLTDLDPDGAAEALDAILATAHEAENDLDTLVGVMDPHRASPLTREVLEVDRPPGHHRREPRRADRPRRSGCARSGAGGRRAPGRSGVADERAAPRARRRRRPHPGLPERASP